MLLKAKHPSLENEKAYLAQPNSAGDIITYLKSVQGLAQDMYVVMGKVGSEKTEVVLITGINTTNKTISHAALNYGHGVDSPVTVIKYNQVRFYKSATIDGTYSLVATVDVDVDDTETKYDYPTGLATDYYKVAYYNETTDTESLKSDPLLGSGYSRNALYSMIQEMRTYVGDKPSDEELTMALNSAQDVVFGLRDKWYFAYTVEEYDTASSTSVYDLPDDFQIIDRVDYVYDDGNTETTTTLTYSDLRKFVSDNASSATASDQAVDYTIDEANNQIIINPVSDSGGQVFKIYYWKRPTPLSEYTDETDVPNPSILVFWAASKIEASKKNAEGSRIFWQEYQQQKDSLTNRRVGKPKNFKVLT